MGCVFIGSFFIDFNNQFQESNKPSCVYAKTSLEEDVIFRTECLIFFLIKNKILFFHIYA